EAITRRFDEPQQERAVTSPVRPPTTTPQYAPHYDAPLIPQTIEPKEKSHRRLIIILASMLVFMIIALGGLLAFLNRTPGQPLVPPRGSTGTTSGGGASPATQTPPAPPTPPSISIGEGKLDPSLECPGAQVSTQVGSNVFALTTSDPVKKVTDWYESKLNITQRVVKEGKSVLISGSTVVTIKAQGSGSSIVIVRGAGPLLPIP